MFCVDLSQFTKGRVSVPSEESSSKSSFSDGLRLGLRRVTSGWNRPSGRRKVSRFPRGDKSRASVSGTASVGRIGSVSRGRSGFSASRRGSGSGM